MIWAWDARFRSTTDEQWEAISAMARSDAANDQSVPLDELYPPDGD